MSDAIRYDVADRVCVVTIDRPEKRNAMTWAMLGEFRAAVARAGDDQAVGVVIVTGAGGAFCAGASGRPTRTGASSRSRRHALFIRISGCSQ